MTMQEWRESVAALSERQATRQGEVQEIFEQALVEFHYLMGAAPKAVQQAYRRLHETSDLEAPVQRRAADLAREAGRRRGWAPPSDDGLERVILSVAVEARAVDEILWDMRDKARPADPNLAWLARGEPEAFVVPRSRAPAARADTGGAYSRRGLRFHRVLPRVIGGSTVRFYAPPIRGPGMAGSDAWLGAALFPDVRPEVAETRGGRGFRVVGLRDVSKVRESLPAQVEAARKHGCLAVVWPELAFPPEMQAELTELLGAYGLEEAAGTAPGIIVAGSWHEPFGEGVANITRILDGAGNELFPYLKSSQFWLGPQHEDILLGEELPVLVYGDLLVAFAICLDFCDLSSDPPYHDMPVDLVLVPSFGNAKTMTSHLDTATIMRVRHDARSFVVQQSHPPMLQGGGYVLPASDDPGALTLSGCRQSENWRTYLLPRR